MPQLNGPASARDSFAPLVAGKPRIGGVGFVIIIAAWLGLLLVRTAESVLQANLRGQRFDFNALLRMEVPIMLVGIAVTPLVLWLTFRFPLTPARWRRNLGVLLLCWLIIVPAMNVVRTWLWFLVGNLPPNIDVVQQSIMMLSTVFHIDLINVLFITGMAHLVLYVRDREERAVAAARLEAQLSEARLHALQAQIHPHFLFNSLHTIGLLVRTNRNQESMRVVELLGSLLRRSLDQRQAAVVPLVEEIRFARAYVDIEQVRFADRLRVEWTIADPALENARVPSLLLQPLLENAVQHGIARSTSAGRITIDIRKVDDRVQLRVRDDGPGIQPNGANAGAGLALQNTEERLRAVLGPTSSLSLRNHPEGGAEVLLDFPFVTT